jgi:hypothetical protein
MPEVARAVILPEFIAPPLERLLSLLLVWDTLEVEDLRNVLAADASAQYLEVFSKLIDHGMLIPVVPTSSRRTIPHAISVADEQGLTMTPAETPAAEVGKYAAAIADLCVEGHAQDVREVVKYANDRGIAPVAASQATSVAVTLPPSVPLASHPEATLIHTATKAISVSPHTNVDDVLSFRDKHYSLMGRFRGAMADLARGLDLAATPMVVMEEASAIMKNRVEPALRDLESAMSRGRIRYTVGMLMGTYMLLLGPTAPLASVTAGGQITFQTLAYAFDRERLLRDHPYGLLYAASSSVARHSSDQPRTIDFPLAALKQLFASTVAVGIMMERGKYDEYLTEIGATPHEAPDE